MNNKTHSVGIFLSSVGKENEVKVKIMYSDGEDVKSIGYLPASWQALEMYILPALEDACMDNHPELKEDSE